ncbi:MULTISPECIES: histidine phosphatase family protein [Brevibacterium]|uniref:Histidine phosphatase family protein n=1 Tax=Brevibacterium salitolerans TaxID=1403566 RepID=A0ABN2WYR9_9MICO|nr:histidine phosphatase family protein [Brevibacterium sp.]
MRRLYVVTHPEATHHVDGLVGGWHDSALTHRGLAHACAIATALRARIPAAAEVVLASSDLLRARQTAETIAAELDLSVRLDQRLREKSYGEAEGRPQAWLDARFIPPPGNGPRLAHEEGIRGAETLEELGTRVYAAMAELLAQEAEHQIVVTHGGALTFAAAAFLRLPLHSLEHMRLRAAPGGITILAEDEFFRNRSLVELNFVSHLAGLSG